MEIQQTTECCVAPNKYTTSSIKRRRGWLCWAVLYSFFMFRLIIICEECSSTIRFTRTEIRRLNDRRGDSTSCEDDHGHYTSTAEELNKITIIVIYLNALYLILWDFVTLLRVSPLADIFLLIHPLLLLLHRPFVLALYCYCFIIFLYEDLMPMMACL